MFSTAAAIVSVLYSPHSPIARLDRDGLKTPEIAAACAVSEDEVSRAMRQIVRTGLLIHDRRTDTYHRPASMQQRQRST